MALPAHVEKYLSEASLTNSKQGVHLIRVRWMKSSICNVLYPLCLPNGSTLTDWFPYIIKLEFDYVVSCIAKLVNSTSINWKISRRDVKL